MKALRSIYINLFVTYVSVIGLYGLSQFIRGGEPLLSWLGLTLAGLAPAGFFLWLFMGKPARTERHPLAVSIVCGLGVAITMAVSMQQPASSGLIHVWAGMALIGWFIYLKWYSQFSHHQASALTLDRKLPDFQLINIEGETIASRDLVGTHHILVFYRGNWCPLCTAQIKELADAYQQLKAKGAEVVLISPQPQGHSQKLARRFDAPMQFMTDPDAKAAKILGIEAEWGIPMGFLVLGYDATTVMPTVIITNPAGEIIFADQTDNYRVRPEPETFLQILDSR